jgi:hypothetical protein
MPDRKTLERFIAEVVAGRHDKAIESFYTEDASMQENLDPPRKGRELLITRERGVMASFKSIRTEWMPPAFLDGDYAVVRWVFVFEGHDGTKRRMEELAYQRWEGDRIAEERFYYDPKQLAATV